MTLGGLLALVSFPAALIYGITGIVRDKNKLLAAVSTVLTGGSLILFFIIGLCG